MQAAQKQIIQTSDQATDKLHKQVGQHLQQMGHTTSTVPTTADTPIPLTDELKQIGVDASHIVGTTFEELISGATHIRETKSKKPLSLFREKAAKVVQLWK